MKNKILFSHVREAVIKNNIIEIIKDDSKIDEIVCTSEECDKIREWLTRKDFETPLNTKSTEPPFSKAFSESVRTMQHAVHENAKVHGWWDTPPEDGTVIMLIVRELSELVEELRIGGRESATIDGFTSMEEELADAVLRILDFAGRKGYRLGQAILAKHAYNLTRPHKHGGKLF